MNMIPVSWENVYAVAYMTDGGGSVYFYYTIPDSDELFYSMDIPKIVIRQMMNSVIKPMDYMICLKNYVMNLLEINTKPGVHVNLILRLKVN